MDTIVTILAFVLFSVLVGSIVAVMGYVCGRNETVDKIRIEMSSMRVTDGPMGITSISYNDMMKLLNDIKKGKV